MANTDTNTATPVAQTQVSLTTRSQTLRPIQDTPSLGSTPSNPRPASGQMYPRGVRSS